MLKHRLTLSLALVLLTSISRLRAEESIRVACMGDSITQGAKVRSATESYPAQLQTLLGGKYEVRNFGRGGASLWHGGNPNAFQEMPDTTQFAPNVVVVMFGINDTRTDSVNYWLHFNEFDGDATKLLDSLLALPTKPRVLLCAPTANFADLPGMTAERKDSVEERLPRLTKVRGKLADIAKRYSAKGVEFVDLNAPTAKRPELFNVDGVHLKPDGYKLLAETLAPHIATSATLDRPVKAVK